MKKSRRTATPARRSTRARAARANTLGRTPNASDGKKTQPLYATPAGLQAHVLVLDADGVLQTDGLIAALDAGDTQGWQLKLDAGGFYAVAGTFAAHTSFWSKVGFGKDTPQAAANIVLKSALRQAGPSTLFVARTDSSAAFDWAVAAGGDNSGMITKALWDVVLTAQPSHSATVAGIFNMTSSFGDQVVESLSSPFDANGGPSTLGSPFVVHLNSQAEYDYCP